ncbi:MAG: hypothetical protein IPL84_18090 [Chitinophagaceae bacterium]|nr:hypothetical protein [Chitinophagaceae bacterium]
MIIILKAASIDAPVTGRQFTSSALTATEQIRFTIKIWMMWPLPVLTIYRTRVNGGAIITESSSAVLPALATSRIFLLQRLIFFARNVQYKGQVKRPGDAQILMIPYQF